MHKATLAALALFTATAAVPAQERNLETTVIADGLFMIEGSVGNVGVITGPDGVVLIDDGVQPLAQKMLETVRSVAGADVDFVVNTHVHGDHTGANAVFNEAGATLIAHDNIRSRLIADAEKDGKQAEKAVLPELTFSDSATFHLNGRDAHVFHVAAAHTDGDAVMHLRTANVIYTGDVFFNGLFPYIDLDAGGSVRGYIAAQQRVLTLADSKTQLIPGHGPLGTRADLQAANDMLQDAASRVAAQIAEGMTLEEVLEENPLQAYHDDWNWRFITTERMTRTLYRSLSDE